MSDVSKPRTTQISHRKAHPTFHFFAGLASGLSTSILLQPADLLKTRVQQSRSSSLSAVLKSILAGPNPVRELWRGTVPSALRTGFGSALYFTTLSTLRQFVATRSLLLSSPSNNHVVTNFSSSSVLPKLTPTQNLVTGATARVLAGLVLMPVTVIKVRYESDFYAYKSLSSATSSIYKTEGIRGFFSGLGATAIRDAPYAGLYVVFYELSKTRLSLAFSRSSTEESGSNATKARQSTSPSVVVNALSGVVAAGIATGLTNPFDAVKTRLQLMPQRYGNMIKAVKLMIHEDGFKSLFDGLGLRMARKAVSSALAWTVYEELIGRAERRLIDEDEDGAGKQVAAVVP